MTLDERRCPVKEVDRAEFTKAMKSTHTILLPNMLHYHNALLQAAFAAAGYHVEILSEIGRASCRERV